MPAECGDIRMGLHIYYRNYNDNLNIQIYVIKINCLKNAKK